MQRDSQHEKTGHEVSVRQLSALCGGRLVDESIGDRIVKRIAFLDEADPESVAWVSEDWYVGQLADSRAAAVIGKENHVGKDPRGIVVRDPESAVADVLGHFLEENEKPAAGIHPTAVIAPDAVIGSGARIGPYAVVRTGARLGANVVLYEGVSIGARVRMGDDCVLYPHVVVYDRCELGNRVILHSGAIIGADGFNYIFQNGSHRKVPQIGIVVLEDDVEVGANTCIDRAKLAETRVGRGTKIDNLVQVAHNVRIAPLCILVSQCGLAGSVRVGQGTVLAGQTGVNHGVTIGKGVRVAAGAKVHGNLLDGVTVSGQPARNHISALRELAEIKKIPKLREQLAELTRRVSELETAADHRGAG